ncbi:MAG TPA: DUF1707 domain-containing protein [Actinomycetes bacterium]|jgi:hypothetical protein|nr:DUF1707 domain-containing protein [Actinomycetes bacterium]
MGSELGRLGGYRVGDTERTRTVELLKEAHVAGYLTLAEIDERLSAALAARTRDDLERLVGDLPPEWRARQQPEPEPPPARSAAPSFLFLIPLLLAVALVVLAVSRGFFLFPWPLLWVFFFAFGRHRHHRRPGGWQGRDSNRVTWI